MTTRIPVPGEASPSDWYRRGRALVRAADLLGPRIEALDYNEKDGDFLVWMDVVPVYGMLVGMATECALKGTIAARGLEVPVDAKRGHDLAILATIGGSVLAGLARSDPDRVKRISDCIRWRGRYPSSRSGSRDRDIISRSTEMMFARHTLAEQAMNELRSLLAGPRDRA